MEFLLWPSFIFSHLSHSPVVILIPSCRGLRCHKVRFGNIGGSLIVVALICWLVIVQPSYHFLALVLTEWDGLQRAWLGTSSGGVETLRSWSSSTFSVDFINEHFYVSNIFFLFDRFEICSEASGAEGMRDVLLASGNCIDSSIQVWVILRPEHSELGVDFGNPFSNFRWDGCWFVSWHCVNRC